MFWFPFDILSVTTEWVALFALFLNLKAWDLSINNRSCLAMRMVCLPLSLHMEVGPVILCWRKSFISPMCFVESKIHLRPMKFVCQMHCSLSSVARVCNDLNVSQIEFWEIQSKAMICWWCVNVTALYAPLTYFCLKGTCPSSCK